MYGFVGLEWHSYITLVSPHQAEKFIFLGVHLHTSTHVHMLAYIHTHIHIDMITYASTYMQTQVVLSNYTWPKITVRWNLYDVHTHVHLHTLTYTITYAHTKSKWVGDGQTDKERGVIDPSGPVLHESVIL